MKDTCIFCGADVSDLGGHICKSCSNKTQINLLTNKLTEYQYKLDRAKQHTIICVKKLGELHWYQYIQRGYLEKIRDMYEELMTEYREIISMLEIELKRNAYNTMGGNAEVERVEQDFEQLTFPLDEN